MADLNMLKMILGGRDPMELLATAKSNILGYLADRPTQAFIDTCRDHLGMDDIERVKALWGLTLEEADRVEIPLEVLKL